jgi:hypothetical protein
MKNNRKKKFLYLGIIIILISCSALLNLFASSNKDTNNNYGNLIQNPSLKSSFFSEEQFNSILEEEKNGLGIVSIMNISYNQKGFTDYSSQTKYESVNDDISNGTLNIAYNGTFFNITILNATRDYLKQSYIDRNILTIRLNESLQVSFDNSSDNNGLAGYLIYLPRLYPIEIKEIIINDTRLIDSEYTIQEINGHSFLYFDYYSYIGVRTAGTFSMDILFDYNLTLANWYANQENYEEISVNKKTQNITANYVYQFNLQGSHYKGDSPDDGTADASDLIVNLKVKPFDKNLLEYTQLRLKGQTISNINDYISNKIIYVNLSDSFKANNSQFLLRITTEFRVQFVSAVGNTWAIDRLVEQLHIRERIYLPAVSEGPQRLMVRFSFLEPSISSDEEIDTSIQFERTTIQISSVGRGIEIITPPLIRGELACPFSIQYQAINSFQITIRDNFNVPLSGLDVKIFYNNKLYGTYISNSWIQPVAPLETNQDGKINLAFLPNGIYTIGIYKNGELEDIEILNTIQPIYDFKTEIAHIPIVVIIFGSISILIITIGVIFHLRNIKNQEKELSK